MEITTYAYERLRDKIEAVVTHIELRNGTTPAIRVAVSDASKVTVTRDGKTITYVLVIKGSDLATAYPVTVNSSALFDAVNAIEANALSREDITTFVFYADEDQLTVTHVVSVPE